MKQMSQHVECATKPRKCPQCGKYSIAKILYGMQPTTDALDKKMAEGKVVLGGCIISDDDPAWMCTYCELSIYRGEAD